MVVGGVVAPDMLGGLGNYLYLANSGLCLIDEVICSANCQGLLA